MKQQISKRKEGQVVASRVVDLVVAFLQGMSHKERTINEVIEQLNARQARK